MASSKTPGAAGSARKSQAPIDSDSDDDIDYSDEEGAVKVDGIYIPPPPVPYCSVENKGPRLVITNITNNFFKSYANQIVLGPFHKSFNAIIGPNGSGKSNVIDSMLFVFGYRANKIRSKKLSVLLHNSKQYTNVTSATVSVHFAQIVDIDNENFETVPNSEFVVSRTANKDNSSHYTIDNKRVQFKEVAVLLKKHGIDLKHNRFLILQGEVEQIAMMPAKGKDGTESGMLEYLEDIVGTTRYKEPLIKLAERVEDYADLKTEKLNRLKIVQEEVEVLREPMEEAVEFLKLENDIAREKNVIYQHNIYAIKENAKEIAEQKETVDAEVKALVENLNKVVQQKKEKEAQLAEVGKKYELMEKRKESLKEAYDQANAQHVQLALEMQQINKGRHKYKDQLAAEEKKMEDYQRQPGEMAAKIEDCEKAVEKLTPKAEELQEEKMRLLANMKDLTKDLQAEKDKLTEELTTLMKAVTETKTAYTLAENELKMLTSTSDNEKRKLENLEKTYEEIKTKIEQITGEAEKLQKVIPVKDKQLQSANQELPNIKQQEGQLINKLRSTRSRVEESKATMQASKSKSRVLDSLMQQKREGNCPGLYGRLGDLGAIDAKYDVAISTACGPLDNIVVDTVETGQWCIDFLKKHDIGRVTIIVLEKQQHLVDVCNEQIRTPENVARLFDLIRIPDERIRPAFYYSLRDTLVANDLDQASRIAYGAQRFRVVTLKGDLIETTGAMSGGGNRVMRGRMGQSVQVEVNPAEIEAMEHEINEQEGVLRQLRQRQNTLENVIAGTQPEVKQMKIALEKMKIELQGLKQREPAVAAQIKEQRTKLKRVSIDVGKVKKMEKVVEVKKASYEEAAAEADDLQQKVDKLTVEIKDKSQGKVKAIDVKLKEHNKNIDKLKNEVTRLKVSMKTAERNATKSEKTITSLREDIKAAETKLLQMKDKRAEIEHDAAELLKLVEELTLNIENGSGDYGDLKGDVKELTKYENKFKSDKIELDQKNKTLKEQLDEVQQRVHALRVKISNLKLQEVPDNTMEPLKEYTPEELEEFNMEKVMRQLELYEKQLKVLKPNMGAIDEYRKKQKIAIARSNELAEVNEKWKQVRHHYDNLRARRKDEFLVGFKIIKSKLKEMYQMITIGGDADFELVDTYDPFSEGIQFRVRPPKKTWKHISNLSGGEKTLSSLALVFALHYYKPSPLYVMDEIDAALDFKNVSIIGNYINERTKNAQFIIISLRSNMFELAAHLIGIYKTYDCTQSLSIDPRQYGDNIAVAQPVVTEKAVQESQQTQYRYNPDSQDLFDDLKQGASQNSNPRVNSSATKESTIRSDAAVAGISLATDAQEREEFTQSPDLFSSQAESEISEIIPGTQPDSELSEIIPGTQDESEIPDIIPGTQEQAMEVDQE